MRSSRGIQEHQVWAAADALIAAGERPTIERVRQQLGSGSPNTVSPMLDSWFKTLPGRLGVKAPTEAEAGYRMPAEVTAHVKALWDVARKEASDLARDAVAAQERQLAQRAEALTIAEAEHRKRQAELADTQAALEAALLKANETINGLERQLESARQRQVAVDAQVEQARSAWSASQADQQRLRDEHAAAMAARDQADRQREDRSDAQQKRALLEIDRAREETRKVTAAAAREAARAVDKESKLTDAMDEATRRLREAESALAAANAERGLQDERMAELERQLADITLRVQVPLKAGERAPGAPMAVRRVTQRRR